MTTYKISGSTTHDASIHIIQNDTYFGKKAVSAGNYEVSIDTTTQSGVIAVAEKSNGHIVGYGGLDIITSSGVADLSASGGALKSLQSVFITIPGASTTGSTSITAVDPDQSIVLFNGGAVNYEMQNGRTLARTYLTDSTTVTAACGATGSYDTYARCYVLEFDGAVNSIQRGETTLINSGFPAQTVDITIDSVDTSKSFITWGGVTCYNVGSTNGRVTPVLLSLPNSTTLRLWRPHQYKMEVIVSWEIVEMV